MVCPETKTPPNIQVFATSTMLSINISWLVNLLWQGLSCSVLVTKEEEVPVMAKYGGLPPYVASTDWTEEISQFKLD